MSTTPYENACKVACEWCAKGIPVANESPGRRMHRFEYAITMDDDFRCLGPTLNQFIESQAALIASQAAEIESLMTQMGELATAAGWNHMESYLRQAEQQAALIQRMRDLLTTLPHSIKRLGKFYGYQWHVDADHYNCFCGAVEEKLIAPALAQVSASPKEPDAK